jgi:hypothetical protein
MRILLQGSFILAVVAFVGVPSAKVHTQAVDVPVPAIELSALSWHSPPPPRTDSVIVVALDGARWQEVLVGTDPRFARGADRDLSGAALMPNLHRMIAEGAALGEPECGPSMVASGPNFVSLPGYIEIFRGQSSPECGDNECPPTRQPTIVDEVRAQSRDVAVFASWAPIVRAAALHPSDFVWSTGEPDTGAFRSDRTTADRAIAYLVERRPSFMFIGLGEPDEYAHRNDYPGYLGSLRLADTVLGELRERVAQMGERGRRTSVFVTCDHGRSDNFQDHGAPWPESSRTWLVASGGAVPARGFLGCTQTRRLADIAPTVRRLLGLPADPSPGAGTPIDELLPSR